MPLHISKVAFGCARIETYARRLEARGSEGESWIDTRYRPTRHEELVGGSLYWIIKHQLVGRSEILGFKESGGRCRIRLRSPLVAVRPKLRRSHQGWRYLADEDVPADLDGSEGDALPPALAGKLAALMLI